MNNQDAFAGIGAELARLESVIRAGAASHELPDPQPSLHALAVAQAVLAELGSIAMRHAAPASTPPAAAAE